MKAARNLMAVVIFVGIALSCDDATQDNRSESCGMDLKLDRAEVDEDTGQFLGDIAGRLCGADMVIHFSELS